jgi:pimeloyl-ACP methyl ester carboxylesterase/tetratricopeptide (TPR) repeat protein
MSTDPATRSGSGPKRVTSRPTTPAHPTAGAHEVGHLIAARDALPAVVHQAERAGLELGIQQLLGWATITTEGWSSSEAESALVRAEELARELEDRGVLARTLHGLATLYYVRGEYDRSESLLVESLGLPSLDEIPGAAVDSNELMACSLYHQGSFARSLEHAETALTHYDGAYENHFTAAFGEHPDVACQLWAALSSWFLGRPDEAMERAERAVAASTIGARARALAQAQASVVAHLRGEVGATGERAAAAIEAASQLGFTYWRAPACVLHGWARALGGDADGGLAEIREGIQVSRGLGARMDDAFYLAVLAGAAARNGRRDVALEALDEACDAAGARLFFFASELRRLRGELLDGADGERLLRDALGIAEELESPSLRLRAATSLARRTRAAEDADLLAQLLGAFQEGRDTADLVAAGALLEELDVEPLPPATAARRRDARPPVRYAESGDLSIAYQVTGSGPIDVLLVPGFVSHLEKDWEEPRHAAFLDRLGSFSRLIRFDKRGTGLSDRPEGVPDLETRMDDIRAVLEAVGSESAVLLGYSEGGPLSVLYAATHPERVKALVLFAAYVKRCHPDDDYPWAATEEERLAHIDAVTAEWGFEAQMKVMCPSADEAMARWWGERCRAAASPGAVRALLRMNTSIDVRHVLPAIRVPTMVVHRGADFDVRVEEGRYIAERIPGARFVELEGDDHFVAIDPDQILDVVEPFVREIAGHGAAEPSLDERVLATMTFTDIAASTPTGARLGERTRAELLARHRELVRGELARHRGDEIDTVGEGFLGLFDGPARAIRCGAAISARLDAAGCRCASGCIPARSSASAAPPST